MTQEYDCIGSYVKGIIHELNCVHFMLFKHLQLTSSCHLWSDFIAVEVDDFFNRVFKLGPLEGCQAVYLEKKEGHETLCDIAVTYSSPYWIKV